MNQWKVALALALPLVLSACGGDGGTGSQTPVRDCSTAPALTKSCIEGTWELSAATMPNLQSQFPSSAGEPLDVSNGANAVYKVQFIVKDKANYNDVSIMDSVIFTKTDETGEETSYGAFTISPDQLNLIMRFTSGDRDGAQYNTAATVDLTTLKFAPSTVPVFANESSYQIAMYFWRIGQ